MINTTYGNICTYHRLEEIAGNIEMRALKDHLHELPTQFRSSHWEMFLLKIILCRRFPVNFEKYFRTAMLQNTCGRLLLSTVNR